jgi:DNA-binding MarR family transcriptional regulator
VDGPARRVVGLGRRRTLDWLRGAGAWDGCSDVLARRAGVHPATITGILDRLERGGWVARDRDPTDRRAVVVRSLRDRYADLMRLYSGMSRSMNQILGGYSDTELELLADFLRRTAAAGRTATDELAANENTAVSLKASDA